MRWILALTLAAGLLLWSSAAAAGPAVTGQDPAPLTVEAYWVLVADTRQALGELQALPAAEVRSQLVVWAARWEAVQAVALPDGQVVTLDSSYLASELRADPPDLDRLTKRLEALEAAHTGYPEGVFTPEALDPLRQILARPEFQWIPAQSAPDWLQRLLDAFNELMERLAYGVQNTVYYGRVPLMIGGAVLLGLALFFIARNLSRSLVREAELAAEAGDEERLLNSAAARQRALALSGQGDYRTAIRYLYLSSLLVLDERGLLRYDRSRTNREYLRSVAGRPELAAPLRDVIEVFDRAWYGFENVDEQTYQAYLQHVDELREKQE